MLSRVRALFERKALDVRNAWALIDFGRQTSSAITVTPEIAWRCPIVRGAVAILSESVGQLPLILYERDASGAKSRATTHPLYEILHDAANDFTSSYEFRRDLQVDLLMHGHAFAHIGRSVATGGIVELVRIPPTAVTLDESDLGEPLYFVTDKQGTRRQIDPKPAQHCLRQVGASPRPASLLRLAWLPRTGSACPSHPAKSAPPKIRLAVA